MHTEPRGSGAGAVDGRRPTRKLQGLTMKVVYMRRSTDIGHVEPRRSPLQALRNVLGLVTVSESLSELSHWRRRSAAQTTEK